MTITNIEGNVVTAAPIPVGDELVPTIGTSPEGLTGEDCPYCPQLMITFRDDDTDVNVAGEVITTGKYLIKYRVFKAGEFTLRVTIGLGLAQEDVGPCVGPCLGGRYAPHDVGTASPFNLLVIAAARQPTRRRARVLLLDWF